MPLLPFDTTLSLSDDENESFADRVTALYASEMATTGGHVAVTIRDREPADLHLGRAVDGPLVFLDAEIRRGRSFERKRSFALEAVTHAGDAFGVPDENVKVVFTEHPGESMMVPIASAASATAGYPRGDRSPVQSTSPRRTRWEHPHREG